MVAVDLLKASDSPFRRASIQLAKRLLRSGLSCNGNPLSYPSRPNMKKPPPYHQLNEVSTIPTMNRGSQAPFSLQ